MGHFIKNPNTLATLSIFISFVMFQKYSPCENVYQLLSVRLGLSRNYFYMAAILKKIAVNVLIEQNDNVSTNKSLAIKNIGLDNIICL